MDQANWLKQTNTPLFPELQWSRPEHKLQAGKLLIVGGTAQGFAAPAEAYGLADKAGVGTSRVVLPESLRKNVSKLFPAAEFAPSTAIGSLAKTALAELLYASMWANGVLFPGDIGRNSETTVLLESFLEKYQGKVTLTKDAADLFCQQPINLAHRPYTLLVIALGQLRRLASELRFHRAFTTDMGLVQLVDNLHELTKFGSFSVITKHQGHMVVAMNGQVSTTKLSIDRPIWRLAVAARASVWWLQNPSKPFEALTTSLFS